MEKIIIILTALIMFFALPLSAYAVNTDEMISDYFEEYSNKIFSSLDDETVKILNDGGFDSLEPGKISDASPGDIVKFIFNTVTGKTAGALKLFLILICVIFLISVVMTFLPEDRRNGNMAGMAGVCVITLLTIPSVLSIFKASAASVSMSSKFMLAFLPLLAGLIAATSKPMMALSLNSVSVYLSEIISSFSSTVLVPFMGVYYSFVCISSFSGELKLNFISNFIKNTVVKILSVVSSLYVGFLSIKGIFMSSAESVFSKGTKVIVSTLIPVIGNTLGEAYEAVSQSMGLIKSTVGIFGIAAIVLINLPVITELFLYSLAFSFSSSVAGMFNAGLISDYLSGVSSALKTLNLILIFSSMLFIITSGIMITIRSNGI